LQPGETVFIPAATGGVGYMAVQLAQLYGAAKVYGGASSEAKRVVVAELGAIPIDYTIEGWPADLIALNGGKGVDLALEVGGGQSVYDTLDATRAGGRVVNYGNVADINAPVNPRALLRRNQTLVGFGRTGMIRDGLLLEERRQIDQEIDAFVAAGKLRPLIGGRFRLDQATEAHRALENRQTAGKVILMPHGFEPDA
jgi:NADPH2:quinone reductase